MGTYHKCLSMRFYEDLQRELTEWSAAHRLRELRCEDTLDNGRIRVNGRELLNFSSNDYLGLGSEMVRVENRGGATGSRLVCGNHHGYEELEARLAALHNTESALVFGSGYLANVGVLSGLAGSDDVIFSDRLNHASIVDGIVLSRARHVRYRHNDMEHLEFLLKRHEGRRRFIVSDAVFSMDGDTALVAELVRLRHDYNCCLILDEAHSGGVTGPRGAGLAAELGLAKEVDVHVGTLSKAYGRYGGFVCCRQILRDYLINRARSVIYSTGLPPILIESVLQAVERVEQADAEREKVAALSNEFREGLQKLGLDCGMSSTQIVPLILGDEERTLRWSRILLEKGVFAVAIRPPTVPRGAARLRFSITAAHDPIAIRQTLRKIEECFNAEQAS